MKRTILLLTIVLISLTLTGCVENKPSPRLESPDRRERIEAVKVVRKKYGTRTPTTPTVNKPAKPPGPVLIPSTLLSNGQPANIDLALVDRWNGSWTSCESYQFAADGTYTNDTLLYTFKGTWIVPSPGTLACRYSAFGTYSFEHFTYRIKGDTLELDTRFNRFTYTRAH